MPNFDLWLSNTTYHAGDQAGSLAVAAWEAILDRPASVQFFNQEGTFQAAQSVRIEHDSNAREVQGPSGISYLRSLTIFGVRNHPDPAIADTVIEAGWRLWYGVEGDVKEYTCLDPIWSDHDVQITAIAYG